jgi:hypothetical protein
VILVVVFASGTGEKHLDSETSDTVDVKECTTTKGSNLTIRWRTERKLYKRFGQFRVKRARKNSLCTSDLTQSGTG